MKQKLEQIRLEYEGRISAADSLRELDDIRVAVMGKKGELSLILRGMGALSAEERPVIGQIVNETRETVESLLKSRKDELGAAQLNERLRAETLDVTMPGRRPRTGHKHPMSTVIDEVCRLFIGMGYEIAEGPDIETDYYNFDALNTPADHPARDTQDTFYIDGGFSLRTQTSTVQVHTMERGELPIRIVAPGKVFRSDAVDATHSPVFHQIEGLVIDKGVTMGDLKGTLALFARELFGEDTQVRFRPHHFPFTEPSAEMDVSCFACGGSGCGVCKGEGWMEILGCGMVHPNVLRMSGIDPENYTGFAFGMGLERIAMQRHKIPYMRQLFENDIKFLEQF